MRVKHLPVSSFVNILDHFTSIAIEFGVKSRLARKSPGPHFGLVQFVATTTKAQAQASRQTYQKKPDILFRPASANGIPRSFEPVTADPCSTNLGNGLKDWKE